MSQNDWSWAGKVGRVGKNRPAVFKGRHFQDEVIVWCVRWYLRYSLSDRDLEEMMAERGLSSPEQYWSPLSHSAYLIRLGSLFATLPINEPWPLS